MFNHIVMIQILNTITQKNNYFKLLIHAAMPTRLDY